MSPFEQAPCRFCEAPGVLPELKVWPGWVEDALLQQPPRSGGPFKAWALRLTHRTACSTCASSWIAHLNQRAQNPVSTLIEGRGVAVGDGRTVGVWMTAIAAVLDSALGRGHVPDWVRGALYADPTRAPRGVSVWLGRYGGTNPGIDLRSRRLFDLIDVFDPDAFVVTLRVGFLVAQLVASQEDDAFRALAEPGRSETTVPVWPGGRVPRWPPERALSDRNFEELSHLTPP